MAPSYRLPPLKPLRDHLIVVAPGTDCERHESLARITGILRSSERRLHQLRGIAPTKRTHALSEASAVSSVSGSSWLVRTRDKAFVRFRQCSVLHTVNEGILASHPLDHRVGVGA